MLTIKNVHEERTMKKSSSKKGKLTWGKLALLGIAFTTGTGFFLGTSLAINTTGFSVLPLFLITAICTYFVYDSLARMIAQDPNQGTFRDYSSKAFGRWAGFSHGWMYWLSEMLILGS